MELAEKDNHKVVLYAEAEEADIFFMKLAFSKAGLGSALRIVRTGQQALDYFLGCGAFADRNVNPVPMVVILALNLPLLSGFDVLRWMRDRADYNATPVVVFSSSTIDLDKETALRLGANDYVVKPNSGLFSELVLMLKEKYLPGVSNV